MGDGIESKGTRQSGLRESLREASAEALADPLRVSPQNETLQRGIATLEGMTRLLATVCWLIIAVSLVVMIQELRSGSFPYALGSSLFAVLALQISKGKNTRRERLAWLALLAATCFLVAQILKLFEQQT